tara:strand:- start:1371 stop:1862 length:492 start_codon:yes stop_codon:yes gene_type:complete
MKVLVSACVLGQNVRWNGTNKLSFSIKEWACSNGITLIPVCPEDELFGTPRPPIRLIHIDDTNMAMMKGKDVSSILQKKCSEIYERNPDIVGFIGISRSPSCGISVGVKNLGRVVKGSMHKTTQVPTVEYNQLRNEKGRQQFLRRLKKFYEHICTGQRPQKSG